MKSFFMYTLYHTALETVFFFFFFFFFVVVVAAAVISFFLENRFQLRENIYIR